MTAALLLIDIQNDFLPGGALGVEDGDAVIEVANRLIPLFDRVVATQDWHPEGHSSFTPAIAPKTQTQSDLEGAYLAHSRVTWPAHCVQESEGAELAVGLELPDDVYLVQKGSDLEVDSYSAFFDNERERSTGLEAVLRGWGVDSIYLAGLTTDYCVKYSALDGAQLGFRIAVVVDGCRPVGDPAPALEEMEKSGVRFCMADEVVEEMQR